MVLRAWLESRCQLSVPPPPKCFSGTLHLWGGRHCCRNNGLPRPRQRPWHPPKRIVQEHFKKLSACGVVYNRLPQQDSPHRCSKLKFEHNQTLKQDGVHERAGRKLVTQRWRVGKGRCHSSRQWRRVLSKNITLRKRCACARCLRRAASICVRKTATDRNPAPVRLCISCS